MRYLYIFHLKVNHFPKSLQVLACDGLLASTKLAIVDEAFKLMEAFAHNQASLADCRPDLALQRKAT